MVWMWLQEIGQEINGDMESMRNVLVFSMYIDAEHTG